MNKPVHTPNPARAAANMAANPKLKLKKPKPPRRDTLASRLSEHSTTAPAERLPIFTPNTKNPPKIGVGAKPQPPARISAATWETRVIATILIACPLLLIYGALAGWFGAK